jgi:hypothetical protein
MGLDISEKIRRFQWMLSLGKNDLPEVSDVRLAEEKDFLDSAQEKLSHLEEVRKEKYKIFAFRKKIAIPLIVVLTPILAYADYLLLFLPKGSDDDSGPGLTLFFFFALYTWVTHPRRQYVKAYKKKILPGLAKLFGDFNYALKGRINMSLMRPSRIIPAHDRYSAEDCFQGTYKGVDIQFAEINLQEKRRSKNRDTYVSVFKGLAVLLEMKNKKFYGHTILDHNKSKISEWFKEKSLDLKRANLVDPEFEDIFDAYTNDQVEARYLVDPLMMERLVGMYEEYEGNKMASAFYDSKMLILIASTHNHFEPADIEIPATDPRSILNMKKEIGEILSIIDRLDLYDPNVVHEGVYKRTADEMI